MTGRVTLGMVSSSCSTSDRCRVTVVMVSNACSTSDSGRVTLVMVGDSCSASDRSCYSCDGRQFLLY